MRSLARVVGGETRRQRLKALVAHFGPPLLLHADRKPRRAPIPAGQCSSVGAPSLLLLDDLAHRVHCLAHAPADMALSLLGLSLRSQVAISYHFTRFFLDL